MEDRIGLMSPIPVFRISPSVTSKSGELDSLESNVSLSFFIKDVDPALAAA